MADETLIGLDIGTTSVKAVLVTLGGTVLAAYDAAYATDRPRPDWVEQAPADWMGHVLAALGGFARGHDLGGLRGIGLTGQVNTHVFADARLDPAVAIDATVTVAEKLDWFAAPMPIDASHALARMAWVARREPEVWAHTAHVLSPKDWVVARLTGVVAADPIAAVGLAGADLAYVGPLIDRVAGAGARLAPLADPLERVGAVRAGLPCAGAPVTLGTMDAWAGMFGLGVTEAGQAMYLSGTSEVLGLISPARVPTRRG